MQGSLATVIRPGAAAAALALALCGAARAQTVGFVAGAEGPVEIQAAGTTSFELAALDRDVGIGDRIRTGRGASVKILLVDDTTLILAEETEIVVDEYAIGPLALSEPSILRQLGGQLRARVGEAFGGTTRLEVHTPTSVLGVKGTAFQVRVAGGTLVCNEEGGVFVRNVDPAIGREIEIPVGLCSSVLPGRAPEPPGPPPADYTPIGDGPSGGVPPQVADNLLFGAGGVAGGGDGGGGDLLSHWVTRGEVPSLPPAPPGAGVEGPPPVEATFEDAVDTLLADDGDAFPSASGAGAPDGGGIAITPIEPDLVPEDPPGGGGVLVAPVEPGLEPESPPGSPNAN